MTARLLVVDDEPELLAEIVGSLRRRGEQVAAASGCTEARRVLQEESVDVLITDARMPDGSGVDLIRDALAGGPRACILITGHVDPGEGVRELGTDVRILYKPFALSALHGEVLAAKRRLEEEVRIKSVSS